MFTPFCHHERQPDSSLSAACWSYKEVARQDRWPQKQRTHTLVYPFTRKVVIPYLKQHDIYISIRTHIHQYKNTYIAVWGHIYIAVWGHERSLSYTSNSTTGSSLSETAVYVSSHCYTCVLILLYMCPYTDIYAAIYVSNTSNSTTGSSLSDTIKCWLKTGFTVSSATCVCARK